MEKTTETRFWQFEASYWFKKLNSSANGLSQVQALKLLSTDSFNKKAKLVFLKDLLLFFAQFKSPLMLLLIGAIIISGFLGDKSNVILILLILLSTALLSFFQERNAGRVVEKLKGLISVKASVLRDGQLIEIKSDQIVKGDVIMLNAGDMLPADCLIIESNELYANESSLTGESFPTRKEVAVLEDNTMLSRRYNCLWEGTNIVSGHARALVIETGRNTLLGMLALRATAKMETTFEKGINEFGFFLMKITLTLSVFILFVNLLIHRSIIDSILFALALAVGMAPELLPAITTIAMSAGAKRMLKKKVIVKKLNSIQSLGEVNLLCTDKTGTITEGNMAISALTDGFGRDSEKVKKLAFWNAYFETGYSNPIDEALKLLKMNTAYLPQKIGEIPYDFIRKRLSIAVIADNEKLLITKGAFRQIMSICSKIDLGNNCIEDISLHKAVIEKKFEEFGTEGIRTIAICYKPIENSEISKKIESEMIFVGFILLEDPVKSGIIETINELKSLNVELKIISGDNKNVAKSIALNIGIKNPIIITGKDLLNTSSEALRKLVQHTHIFAEVEPQQKEQIILALKKTYKVAYLGDGINDVTAISAADVGISVENAVDATREAADFVLMEKDLMVVADGIKEGRITFANTMKYLYISTGATFGNMISVAAASIFLPFLPMLPTHILLTNILTDLPYLSIANDNVDKKIMKKPGVWNIKIIRNYMFIFGIHSSLFDIITFFTLYYILKVKEAEFQTGWFIESVLTELCILFVMRTHKFFFRSKPTKLLLALSLAALIITVLLPYIPLGAIIGLRALPILNIVLMLAIVMGYIFSADFLKYWFFRKYSN